MPNHLTETLATPTRLVVHRSDLEAMHAHALRDYPLECCGALLGSLERGFKHVKIAIPLHNIHEEGGERRFRIAPEELLNTEKLARKTGLQIIGFYHSHPDSPAKPSEYDRENAWEDYSYLIISVRRGRVLDSVSWALSGEGRTFEREAIDIDACLFELVVGN